MPHIQRTDVKVYYESYGEGTPIVFLHPFSTNRNIWHFQTFAFAENYRCIIVDHRGHGSSDKPTAGYAIEEQAADVIAIMDDAGIDKAVLVGNSIGGMIAMQVNLDAPERVIGNLILSSGTNLAAGMPPEAGEAFQQDWRAAFAGLLEGTLSEKSKKDKPELMDLLRGYYMTDDNFTEDVFVGSSSDPSGVFNWNITSTIGNIARPTLVIAGVEDQATTVEANQFLSDNIPNAELKIVENVGHFYQLERPSDFNDELRGFLSKLSL